jgi:O-antigen/teichoic acid export membrane protein
VKDLKHRVIRGGLVRIVSQASTLILRTGSIVVMARLLSPKDFGLVGMVTAVIGVFSVFKDFGLSAAAIQRSTITADQSSALFWINLLVGACLSLLTFAMAPFVAAFYHEPRVVGVAAVLAMAFFFNSAGVQHSALIERQMRFITLSVIDMISLLTGTAIGICMALRGFGYWSLVAVPTITPLTYTVCVWLIAKWIPGRPHRHNGILPMMRFGGALTLNGLISYTASNADKVLLGRFCGVEALGIYGRAYQLINVPTDNLNSAAGGVAFAALSRLQSEPARMKSYFLKGYSLILSLTVPIIVTCGVYAADIIRVFLGQKWASAAPVFRLLAPAMLTFAILIPLQWLLASCGLVGRGLRISLVRAPILIVGCVIGLHWGPKGVACAYSVVMGALMIPMMVWAVFGTPVSVRDLIVTVSRPLFSGIVAASVGLGVQFFVAPSLSVVPRLILGATVICSTYLLILIYALNQKRLFMELFRGLAKPSSHDESLVLPT